MDDSLPTAVNAPDREDAERALRVRDLFRRAPVFCGAFAVIIGTIVFSGWWFGVPRMTSLAPGLPPTVANNAVMAVLAGWALILSASSAPKPFSRRRVAVAKLCAGIVLLMATATLGEYVFGVDFAIDQVLISTKRELVSPYAGRPSPQTATAFLLSAVALLNTRLQSLRGRKFVELLAVASGLIPLTALLGYLFEVAALYGPLSLLPYTWMSIPTALVLIAVSSGIVASGIDGGALSILTKDDGGGTAARHLAVWILVFVPVVCAIALGARLGFYTAPLASALVVLFGFVAGTAFVLRVSWRLSRLDAKRKQAQDELRQVHERIDLALRGADLAAWDWNISTGEVIFNSRWAEMRGFRPDEIEPRVESWTTGIHPEDWPRVQRILEDYFQGRIAEYEAEHRVRTKSGQWIWILDRGKVFARDERGQPIRMAGTELDITARKRLEEEVRVSEAKSSGILSISADAIISIDDGQHITMFNEGAEKLFGYSKEEAIGFPLDMLIPERFRAKHREHVARFAAGGELSRKMGARGGEIYGRRKNGEEFPADAAISKLAVDGKRVLTVALRDVSEQRRSENERAFLAEVGAILSSTLEAEATLTSIGQLATRTLADVCIVYVVEDEEVRRVKAIPREPSRAGVCDALMVSPSHLGAAPAIWAELLANRSVLLEQVSPETVASLARSEEHLRALRALEPNSIIIVPLFAHGKLVGAMALISSTPSRTYTTADVRFAEEVAQRAAFAIENARLYAEAQRAIRTRDEVLGIVAHDLRNPLGAIVMQAALFRRPSPEPERRSLRPAEMIERSAKRMNRLIEDLLDVTRMEAGRLVVERARVSARELIGDFVQTQTPLATAVGLDLRIDVAPGLPDVWADRDRLQQVFENLVGNAVKFTGTGGVVVVGAARRDGDILFWVSDTGPGIASADVAHVFDRFYQVRKPGRRGAGLGLPIVKGIVEAHEGRIWVESTPGRGTTFFFTIPSAPASDAEPAAPAPHAA